MRVVWGAATHVGMLRQQNEDSYAAEDGVFVVADGMGGHNAGEVASALAVRGMREAALRGFASPESVVAAINLANSEIHRASGGPTDQRGMGTTITVAVPIPAEGQEPQRMVVANVGDSRVYLWRDGGLRQVSSDHSYVQELLTEGYITAAEARVHPRRNIVTRALGIEGDVNADSWVLPMLAGDRYLLCSDGLVDEVDDERIAEILQTTPNPQEAADQLVATANSNGGRDNVTVVVVDVLHDRTAEPTDDGAGSEPPARKRLVPALAAGILVAALVALGAVGWYAREGYFVGFDGDGDDATLVVFKGRVNQILWFAPTVHLDGGVSRSEVFPALVADIERNPTYESPGRAEAYVNSIRGVVEAQRDPAGDGS